MGVPNQCKQESLSNKDKNVYAVWKRKSKNQIAPKRSSSNRFTVETEGKTVYEGQLLSLLLKSNARTDSASWELAVHLLHL